MTKNTQKNPQGLKGYFALFIYLLTVIAGAFSEHLSNCIGNL